jgi:hypothetical protein
MANQFENFMPAATETGADNLGSARVQQYSPESMAAMTKNTAAGFLPDVSFGPGLSQSLPTGDNSQNESSGRTEVTWQGNFVQQQQQQQQQQWMPLAVVRSQEAGQPAPARDAQTAPARDVQPAAPQVNEGLNQAWALQKAKTGIPQDGQRAERVPPLRAGIDFEVPAPVAANLRGDNYLRDRLNNTPQMVREHVNSLIDRLQSPTTRAAAQEALRAYGPAAVPSLIVALDSTDWQTRHQAHQQVRLMGEAALPGLMTYVDGGPTNLEGRRRAEQLINELQQSSQDGVRDAQGRLRRGLNKFGNLTFSADYDDQGSLTSARWDHEQFHRNQNGSYSREGYDGIPFRNVSVTLEGNLRFTVGDTTMQWSRDGIARAFGPDGRPRFSSYQSSDIQLQIQVGNRTVDVSALPVQPYSDYKRR